jgi:hypothetical protein
VTNDADKCAAETQALLKILKLGDQQIKDGKTRPIEEVVRRMRARTR